MDLSTIRAEIDTVDKQIVDLYEQRMSLCNDVADYKIETGKKVLDKERENQKIEAVMQLATDQFNKYGVRELFSQIMSMSRKLQYRKLVEHGIKDDYGFSEIESLDKACTVVYQGEEGAYSHEATLEIYGRVAKCYNVASWRDAMEDIKSGKASYGVFPIENSTAGIVSPVYDLLEEYDNYIVAEKNIAVGHVLVGLCEASINDIEKVFSHPQALMQCERYLYENKWEQISCTNTAVAAKKVSDLKDKTKAAIASRTAARIYGLKILATDIATSDNNTTRFIVVGRKREYVNSASKISLCFEIPHESGSLYNALSHFIYNGINMTKIESRPIPEKTWEYRFFVDIDGQLNDAAICNALAGLEQETNHLRILGNY